ncbi:hypothetical protein BN3660_03272 [Eubacteriaceae bacterium CHKCI004]|nr:hypothetical protein BN3660_03272 [Eubacteriaceae bacterium CHKCI004]
MLLSQYLTAQLIYFIIYFKGILILSIITVRKSKLMQSCKRTFIFFAIISFTLLGYSLRPGECMAVIKPDIYAGTIHIIKFFHRLDQSRLRSIVDEHVAPLLVHLHTNAAKIREADQEIMFRLIILRLAVIFSSRYLLYPFQ